MKFLAGETNAPGTELILYSPETANRRNRVRKCVYC